MRILTVCTSTQIFGTEVATLNLLRAFLGRGFKQLAVTSTWTDGEFSKRLGELGVPEAPLPLGTFAKPLSGTAIRWTLNAAAHAPQLWLGWHRTVKTFRPDILLLTNPKQALWLYPWLNKQPSFLIEHGMKALSAANRWMYGMLQERLAGFIAVSRFMAGHLQDLGADPGMVHVIYNCFPADEVTDTRRVSGSLIRIGIAGQISPHKGHDMLLEAARLLNRRGIDFEVVIFGDGRAEYISDLRARVDSMGLSHRWKWMGYATAQEQMYQSMDVCVVPSRFDEPFGLVAVEASKYRLPVIAARRGGLPEIVNDGETGFLIDSEKPEELADRIAQLATDRDLAVKLGRNGRARVLREFPTQRMLEGYEELFRRALAPDGAGMAVAQK